MLAPLKRLVVGQPIATYQAGHHKFGLFGGLAVLTRIEPAAALGWIALVVGLHFIPLSRLWPEGRRQILSIGVVMTALGLVGLALAFATHEQSLVALVSGVGSGAVLLGSSLTSALRTWGILGPT